MFEDYSERLFSHFLAGRWRVPFATRALPLCHPDGRALGQIVPAEARDIARAASALRAADARSCARAADMIGQSAASLCAAHAHQTGMQIDPEQIGVLARAMVAPCGPGQRVILGAPITSAHGTRPGETFGAALGAGLRGGVIWCPPPDWAIFATHLAEVLQRADLPPGAFALLHAQTPGTEAAIREVLGRRLRMSQ